MGSLLFILNLYLSINAIINQLLTRGSHFVVKTRILRSCVSQKKGGGGVLIGLLAGALAKAPGEWCPGVPFCPE